MRCSPTRHIGRCERHGYYYSPTITTPTTYNRSIYSNFKSRPESPPPQLWKTIGKSSVSKNRKLMTIFFTFWTEYFGIYSAKYQKKNFCLHIYASKMYFPVFSRYNPPPNISSERPWSRLFITVYNTNPKLAKCKCIQYAIRVNYFHGIYIMYVYIHKYHRHIKTYKQRSPHSSTNCHWERMEIRNKYLYGQYHGR